MLSVAPAYPRTFSLAGLREACFDAALRGPWWRAWFAERPLAALPVRAALHALFVLVALPAFVALVVVAAPGRAVAAACGCCEGEEEGG